MTDDLDDLEVSINGKIYKGKFIRENYEKNIRENYGRLPWEPQKPSKFSSLP